MKNKLNEEAFYQIKLSPSKKGRFWYTSAKTQTDICYGITCNWGLCGEPAISHDSHHVSLVQWNNLFASRHKGHRFKSPGGYLRETGILLLALSRYIGDPDVIDHQQGFPPPPTVTRPSCRQCDSPTWSHTAFLSQFHARCRSSFWLHIRRSRLLGGSPMESLQSHIILTMSHWSSGLTCLLPATRVTGSNALGGTYVKPGFSC
jgi:hypothetical protein